MRFALPFIQSFGPSFTRSFAIKHTKPAPSKPTLGLVLTGCLLLVSALSGCRPEEEIRTYVVPRVASKTVATESVAGEMPGTGASASSTSGSPSAEPTHQMLGAMIASGDGVWFFKLVGTLAELSPLEDALKSFFKDQLVIKDNEPKWTLPEGWTETAGSGMRFATIQVPVEGQVLVEGRKSLEMSVIRLPKAGPWNAQVLSNVNRWRGQLGLPPTGEPALKLSTSPLPQSEEALLVDLKGVYAGGMTPPFAGAFEGGSPMPAKPTAPAPSSPPQGDSNPELKYEVPEGWVDKGGSGMRKANLMTGDDANAAEITVFQFSAAAPAMADPLANVNRWRQQVELDIIDQAKLDELKEAITINGDSATYIEMIPEAEALKQASIAAMQEREGQVWFYKLSGTREEVKAQRDAFKAWLESIQL